MDWEMMAIVGWIGALIINVIFTIDTTKERRKYCEKYEKLWEKEELLEHREAELDNREKMIERREREIEEKECKIKEKWEVIRERQELLKKKEKEVEERISSGVLWRDEGICGDCVHNKLGCLHCGLCYDDYDASPMDINKWGWSEEIIEKYGGIPERCARATGTCAYYQDDVSEIIYCKDCKFGVKKNEPDENGFVWECEKNNLWYTGIRGLSGCPCGERKEEGGNEE